MVHFKMACYMIIGLIMLAAGCAPSAAKKTDTASASADSIPKASTSPSPGEGKRDAARESTTDRSSLGELQEGKSSESTGPLKDILYDYDSYSLRADAREILRANADWLKGNQTVRVEIEGHCDERGTNE